MLVMVGAAVPPTRTDSRAFPQHMTRTMAVMPTFADSVAAVAMVSVAVAPETSTPSRWRVSVTFPAAAAVKVAEMLTR